MLLLVPCFAYLVLVMFMLTLFIFEINIHGFRGAFRENFKVFDTNRKVGGIRFLKLGRLNISLSLSKKG